MLVHFGKKLILVLTLATSMSCFAVAKPPSPSEAMSFLQSLKSQNTARIQDTEKAISKKLDETKDTRVLETLHADVEKLRAEKKELMLRQDFLDRLIFQFDTKYDGSHTREFIEGALKSMTQVEIANANTTTNMWPFLDNLRRLISRIPDQQDRVLNLVEAYMKQTSIASPMNPDEFMKNVAYSNGSQTEGAKPMDRTAVGFYTDKQLKVVERMDAQSQQPAVQETRMKAPPAPEQVPAKAPEKTAN